MDAKKGRPPREEGSRQIHVWLPPDSFETLERWRLYRRYPNRTETLIAMLRSVRKQLQKMEEEDARKDARSRFGHDERWSSAEGEKEKERGGPEGS